MILQLIRGFPEKVDQHLLLSISGSLLVVSLLSPRIPTRIVNAVH